MRLKSPICRTATAVLAVAASTSLTLPHAAAAPSVPTAVSQLPGASAAGTVVITDSPRVSVTVAPHTSADEQVKLIVTNNYDHKYRCAAPAVSNDPAKPREVPNVVATAEIVNKSVDYYRSHPFAPQDSIAAPVLGVIPLDGLLRFVPEGSLSRVLGSDISSRAELSRMWDGARLVGHAAEIKPFDLEPMKVQEFTVPLDAPAHGQRTDFPAAALLFCTDTEDNTAYVFAGYEPGAEPATHDASGSSNAMGSISALGSTS